MTELETAQSKESFKLRMRQFNEMSELVEKQKHQREWKVADNKQKLNTIIHQIDQSNDPGNSDNASR